LALAHASEGGKRKGRGIPRLHWRLNKPSPNSFPASALRTRKHGLDSPSTLYSEEKYALLRTANEALINLGVDEKKNKQAKDGATLHDAHNRVIEAVYARENLVTPSQTTGPE
jgi:hypothetical protein